MAAKRKTIDIPFADWAEVSEFVRQFEACRWPYERWTHRAHIAVGVFYLRSEALPKALIRVRDNIQRYNRTCGDPNGYHETITVSFMRLLDGISKSGIKDVLAAETINRIAETHDMQWLLTFYSPKRLWSAEARIGWVEPDLKPFDF